MELFTFCCRLENIFSVSLKEYKICYREFIWLWVISLVSSRMVGRETLQCCFKCDSVVYWEESVQVFIAESFSLISRERGVGLGGGKIYFMSFCVLAIFALHSAQCKFALLALKFQNRKIKFFSFLWESETMWEASINHALSVRQWMASDCRAIHVAVTFDVSWEESCTRPSSFIDVAHAKLSANLCSREEFETSFVGEWRYENNFPVSLSSLQIVKAQYLARSGKERKFESWVLREVQS